MDGDAQNMDKVEAVFQDFRGRRTGLIKALTTDVQRLYQECDRVLGTEEENGLCLFGLPDGTWEAKKPAEYVPTELPEYPAPAVGFNRVLGEEGGINKVAAFCDVWLIAMAFSHAVQAGLDSGERQRLFNLIMNNPTLLETVKAEEENEKISLCGKCGKWYHGKCVNISEEESKHFSYYKCLKCMKKKPRRLTLLRQS